MPPPPGVCEALADIEDCIGPESVGPLERLRAENKVLPRALRRKTLSPVKPATESFIAGTQSIYIKTWGCSHNNSDGEYMAGLLAVNGYSITGKLHSSNIVASMFGAQ